MRSVTMMVALLAAFPAVAQTPPRWEIGAIRPNTSGSGVSQMSTRGGKLVGVNITVEMLIRSAYGFESYRIVGAPSWWSRDRYDITAVASGPATPEQTDAMTQQMLAEHFKLAVHVERRELDTYRLVLGRPDGRLGPSLTPFTQDCDALLKSGKLPEFAPRSAEDFAAVRPCSASQGPGILAAGGRAMDFLTRVLGGELGAPVTDGTGLTGMFNIALRWNPDPRLTGIDAKYPSLTTAVQEQLGLKLESRRESMEVLVIDRLERPASN